LPLPEGSCPGGKRVRVHRAHKLFGTVDLCDLINQYASTVGVGVDAHGRVEATPTPVAKIEVYTDGGFTENTLGRFAEHGNPPFSKVTFEPVSLTVCTRFNRYTGKSKRQTKKDQHALFAGLAKRFPGTVALTVKFPCNDISAVDFPFLESLELADFSGRFTPTMIREGKFRLLRRLAVGHRPVGKRQFKVDQRFPPSLTEFVVTSNLPSAIFESPNFDRNRNLQKFKSTRAGFQLPANVAARLLQYVTHLNTHVAFTSGPAERIQVGHQVLDLEIRVSQRCTSTLQFMPPPHRESKVQEQRRIKISIDHDASYSTALLLHVTGDPGSVSFCELRDCILDFDHCLSAKTLSVSRGCTVKRCGGDPGEIQLGPSTKKFTLDVCTEYGPMIRDLKLAMCPSTGKKFLQKLTILRMNKHDPPLDISRFRYNVGELCVDAHVPIRIQENTKIIHWY